MSITRIYYPERLGNCVIVLLLNWSPSLLTFSPTCSSSHHTPFCSSHLRLSAQEEERGTASLFQLHTSRVRLTEPIALINVFPRLSLLHISPQDYGSQFS